jgi:hypothetical protein
MGVPWKQEEDQKTLKEKGKKVKGGKEQFRARG